MIAPVESDATTPQEKDITFPKKLQKSTIGIEAEKLCIPVVPMHRENVQYEQNQVLSGKEA
jgi:hypothetical protein